MKIRLLSHRTLLAVALLSLGALQAQDAVETKDKLQAQDKVEPKAPADTKDKPATPDKLAAPDKLEAPDREKPRPGRFEANSPGSDEKWEHKLLQKKAKPAKPGVKAPFLGVVLGEVDEALAAQLNLPEGTGVLVRAVMDGSPAAKAGLKEFDVLRYLNDQLLVNEPQLQTLVRQAGVGTDVKLTLMRGGKTEYVTVKLGEHEFQDVVKGHPGLPGREPITTKLPPGLHNQALMLQNARVRESLEDEIREFRERIQKLQGNTEAIQREVERFRSQVQNRVEQMNPKGDKEPGKPAKVEIKVLGDDKNGKNEAIATAISTTTDSNGNTVIIQKNSARTTWTNESGSGELVVENGSKKLTARDSKGKEVFSGPIDTDEQRAKVPAELREQLERIEKSVKIEVRPEPAPKK